MKSLRLLPVAGLLLLAACSPAKAPAPSAPAADASPPVATINGRPISRSLYELYAKSMANKPSAELTAEQRTQLLDALVRNELAADEAVKQGLDQKGDAPAALELGRLQVLPNALGESYFKDKKVTDEELKAEYDTQVAALPKTQYHVLHILVKTQDEAQKIIDQLKKGAKFEDLAKKNSIDTGSAAKGGDLDWVSPAGLVKPFADALVAMKKGETSTAPVQSQFGFHVIRLLDTRETTPPPFDTVKSQVENIVLQKKWKAYTDELEKNAKVEKLLKD
jgi:peptidyl-prolyl cis-trans isomerase C